MSLILGEQHLFLLPEGEPIAVEHVSKSLYWNDRDLSFLWEKCKNERMAKKKTHGSIVFENIFKEGNENEQAL